MVHGFSAALCPGRVIVGLSLLVARMTFAQPSGGDEEWVSLFNGHDLDGWVAKIRHHPVGENFANTFRVEDGAITVSYDGYDDFDGQFGHLFYQQPFSHYRLRFEYRIPGEKVPDAPEWATRNSGVMLHSQAPETMALEQDFPISLEVQLLGGLNDGQPRPTGNLCTPGTNVVYDGKFTTTHCINASSPTFDDDEWVKAGALVLGDRKMVHYIDGEAVIEYTNPTYGGVGSGILLRSTGSIPGPEGATDHRPETMRQGEPVTEGYIALQSEGHPVQFRHVALLNLKGCMDPESGNYKRYYVEPDPESCR